MLKPSENPSPNEKISRYSLVVAIAKRAREISAAAEESGTILVEKPVDVATREYMQKKYKVIEPERKEYS